MNPTLSYVMTTRNKLPFLQQALKRLLARVLPDEEVVVIDGASTDGTAQYLQQLHQEGRIHVLVSEPDVSESHGWNKGLLAARGSLIKLITDDDAFCFDCVQRCREFMLAHSEIHVLAGDMGYVFLRSPESVHVRPEARQDYLRWQAGGPPFWFNGIPLLIRRRSLALTGLMHAGVHCPDTEYSLRITSLPRFGLAWYTGVMCIRIDNPGSNWRNITDSVQRDSERVLRFYREAVPRPPSTFERIFAFLRRKAARLVSHGATDHGAATRPAGPSLENLTETSVVAAAFEKCDELLKRFDATETGQVLYPSPRTPA